MKASYLKHLEIPTEQENRYIWVLSFIGSRISIHQYKRKKYFTWHILFFSTCKTHFHWFIFILLALLKGCLCWKIIFCCNIIFRLQLMFFFYYRKKLCFVLKIFRFLYFPWICKLQILWHHNQNYCILGMHVLMFPLNPI